MNDPTSMSVLATSVVLLVLCTSFVKFLTVFSIIRLGVGLEGAGFGLVVIAASLGLSFVAMGTQFDTEGAMKTMLEGSALPQQFVDESLRPYMHAKTDSSVLERIQAIQAEAVSPSTAPEKNEAYGASPEPRAGEESVQPDAQRDSAAEVSFDVLIGAFLISELREAFRIGLLLLIPFFVLDVVVMNVLMSLGVHHVSHQVIALPLKICLFFALDVWLSISEKLLGSAMV